MSGLVNGKDFFDNIRKIDMARMAFVANNWSTTIMRNIIERGYCKLACAEAGPDIDCSYLSACNYSDTFGDPVEALKEAMVDQYGYRVISEIVATADTRVNVLKQKYESIGKRYDPNHLVIGYKFGLNPEEEAKRREKI